MSTRTLDSVYGEIAGLTGNRAELERERFMLVKAIRSLKALQDDNPVSAFIGEATFNEITGLISQLEIKKALVWDDILHTDAGIQRLTDLAQNGAFNENR